MFDVKVRDNLFIAHSLKDEFFGLAKNLHGATYVIDIIISSTKLTDKNIVIDIGLASSILKKCIEKYNYKNLDDLEVFQNEITTTEFMAKTMTYDFIDHLKYENIDLSTLSSIQVILNESHIASASYKKILD